VREFIEDYLAAADRLSNSLPGWVPPADFPRERAFPV